MDYPLRVSLQIPCMENQEKDNCALGVEYESSGNVLYGSAIPCPVNHGDFVCLGADIADTV